MRQNIPCISVRPPWSVYICPPPQFMGSAVTYHDRRYVFPKDIENRSQWFYDWQGPMLIHSSKTYETNAPKLLPLSADSYPKGCIVGIVTCEGTVIESESPWYIEGMTGIVLSQNKTFVKPIQWSGKLGLFDVPYRFVAEAIKDCGYTHPKLD